MQLTLSTIHVAGCLHSARVHSSSVVQLTLSTIHAAGCLHSCASHASLLIVCGLAIFKLRFLKVATETGMIVAGTRLVSAAATVTDRKAVRCSPRCVLLTQRCVVRKTLTNS